MGKDDPIAMGVCFTALYKCEEEVCGKLFVTSVYHFFPVEGVQVEGEPPPAHTEVHCPDGHTRVKFIQSIDKDLFV